MVTPAKNPSHARHVRVKNEIFRALCLTLLQTSGHYPNLRDYLRFSPNRSLSSFYCHYHNFHEAVAALLSEHQKELGTRLERTTILCQKLSSKTGKPPNEATKYQDFELWRALFTFLSEHQKILLAFEAQSDCRFLDLVAYEIFSNLSVSAPITSPVQRGQTELLFVGTLAGLIRGWAKQDLLRPENCEKCARQAQKLTTEIYKIPRKYKLLD